VTSPDRFLSWDGVTPVDGKVPVLLVPGWMANDATMGPLRERFIDAGWPPHWVGALAFQDPVGSNREHARELDQALEALRSRTGAERVDVVAHSMGGLATRVYLQGSGEDRIRRVVFVATPHQGTLVASLAWGEGGKEMRPGSAFLLELDELRGVPRGVEALTLRTPVDFHILPPSSGTLPGVPDVEICCPGHEGILNHPDAFEAMQRFLTREETRFSDDRAPTVDRR
jgi:triacylglycerol lipase